MMYGDYKIMQVNISMISMIWNCGIYELNLICASSSIHIYITVATERSRVLACTKICCTTKSNIHFWKKTWINYSRYISRWSDSTEMHVCTSLVCSVWIPQLQRHLCLHSHLSFCTLAWTRDLLYSVANLSVRIIIILDSQWLAIVCGLRIWGGGGVVLSPKIPGINT